MKIIGTYFGNKKFYMHFNKNKFEVESDVDGTQILILDSYELESINKAAQFVDNSLKILVSLAKK